MERGGKVNPPWRGKEDRRKGKRKDSRKVYGKEREEKLSGKRRGKKKLITVGSNVKKPRL